MPTFKTDNDELFRIQKEINKLNKKKQKDMTDDDHKNLRGLFRQRAKELSKITGMKISSLFEDD